MTRVDAPPQMKPFSEDYEVPWGGQWSTEGVVQLLEPMVLDRRRERLNDVLAGRLESVTVLLDELDNPHNRSAIVRSCDAFGLQRIHALQPGSDFAVHHGTAAGTERWVDLVQYHKAEAAVEALERSGHELILTHPDGELLPEDLADVPRLALVLGNEHRGIQPVFERAAKRRVRVPMRGFVESLNVSVTAALLVRASTQGRAGDLSPESKRILYARSLFQTVPRAGRILEGSEPA